MEGRLTFNTELGVSIDKNEDCPTCSICWNCDMKVKDCKYFKDAVDKLANYEDKEGEGRIIMRANENIACYLNKEQALNDRKLFVHNLGELLSQTREDVLSAELDDNEIVTVTFVGGGTRKVNVNLDSYLAIIKDVVKCI